jgi:hypothetical protein
VSLDPSDASRFAGVEFGSLDPSDFPGSQELGVASLGHFDVSRFAGAGFSLTGSF